MFHIFGFIFLLILIVLFIGLTVIGTLLRTLFRWKAPGKQQTQRPFYQSSSNARTEPTEEGNLHINPNKLFGKDEGEYVDFEEIKE